MRIEVLSHKYFLIRFLPGRREADRAGGVDELFQGERADNLILDLEQGTLNGVTPVISQDEAKTTFPCYTGSTAEGEMWNYGGGVFFINDDFYIYTAKDYIEVRKNFTGKVTGDWLGKSRDTLMASFGEPSIMKNERYYYL